MVVSGKYNLSIRVKLNVPMPVFAEFRRHCRGQEQTCRIFQKPCPGLGIEPVPLILDVHACCYRLPVRLAETEFRPDGLPGTKMLGTLRSLDWPIVIFAAQSSRRSRMGFSCAIHNMRRGRLFPDVPDRGGCCRHVFERLRLCQGFPGGIDEVYPDPSRFSVYKFELARHRCPLHDWLH